MQLNEKGKLGAYLPLLNQVVCEIFVNISIIAFQVLKESSEIICSG